MAFECSISDWGAESAECLRSDDGRSHFVIVPVGHDPDISHSYFLFVNLAPCVTGDGDELAFCINEYDADGNQYEIWSSEAVAKKIGSADRAKILAVLVAAIAALIEIREPAKITMCMFEPATSQAPLRKYVAILRKVESMGYRISAPDVYHGQRLWWMERQKPAVIDKLDDDAFIAPSNLGDDHGSR